MRNSHLPDEAPPLTSDMLVAELALQSNGGPNVEDPTAAMFKALVDSDHPGIRGLLEDAATSGHERGITKGAMVSALRTIVVNYCQTKAKGEGETFSDVAMVKTADWEKPIVMLGNDLKHHDSTAIELIWSGLSFRNAATPVKERYASIAAMTQLVRERFPAGASGLSIGCSIMPGELQLMHSDEYPMSLRKVTLPDQQDATSRVNGLIGRTSPFKQIVGVDKDLLYYKGRQEYDKGNYWHALSGLRPSERNSPDYMGELQSLLDKMQQGEPAYTPDNGVTFHRGNPLKAAELEEFTGEFPEPFDIIMMNFLTQELSPADQIRLHEVATQLVSKNGLIMYNHQAYIPPFLQGQPTGIREVHHYGSYATTKFTSAMHYMDMLNPVRGLQEAMRFHNNRCQIARINKVATLMVNEKLEPLSDLLAHG